MCPAPEVAAGHFKPDGNMPASLTQPLASFLCEIAVQFRCANGGVGLNDRAVSTWLQQQLSQA